MYDVSVRTRWHIKLASLYMFYDKVPWELGYPFYEEIHAIMPLVVKEVHKRRERHRKNPQAEADFEEMKRQNQKGKSRGLGSY